MKHQKFCDPRSGKLVHQVHQDIMFAYDLYLGHTIGCQKCLSKEKISKKGRHHALGYCLPQTPPLEHEMPTIL